MDCSDFKIRHLYCFIFYYSWRQPFFDWCWVFQLLRTYFPRKLHKIKEKRVCEANLQRLENITVFWHSEDSQSLCFNPSILDERKREKNVIADISAGVSCNVGVVIVSHSFSNLKLSYVLKVWSLFRSRRNNWSGHIGWTEKSISKWSQQIDIPK